MFQNLVPISVYITVEVVKVIQAWFIWMDNEMLDVKTGIRCIARTWNLSDDLGMIV
jgi:phospholipid-translocating ATPase